MFHRTSINDRLRAVHERSLTRSFGNSMSTLSDRGRRSEPTLTWISLAGFALAIVMAVAILSLPSYSNQPEISATNTQPVSHSLEMMGDIKLAQIKTPVSHFFMVPIHTGLKTPNANSIFTFRENGFRVSFQENAIKLPYS